MRQTTRRRPGRSRSASSVGYLGPIPDDLWEVLGRSWESPLSISSNLARSLATEVALAASLGWISNVGPDGKDFRRHWHITKEGLVALENSTMYAGASQP